jgi:hypothetical protein
MRWLPFTLYEYPRFAKIKPDINTSTNKERLYEGIRSNRGSSFGSRPARRLFFG